jgi:hypothetical protein
MTAGIYIYTSAYKCMNSYIRRIIAQVRARTVKRNAGTPVALRGSSRSLPAAFDGAK